MVEFNGKMNDDMNVAMTDRNRAGEIVELWDKMAARRHTLYRWN